MKIEDVEEKWNYIGGRTGVQCFEHSDYGGLVRVIDIKNEKIHFTDRRRIEPKNVIDINKALPEVRKIRLVPQILRVIDAEKPIAMPYTPEKLKVYIEDLDDYFGVLFYRDYNDENNVVAINRFFKIEKGIKFDEVTYEEYQKFKEEKESVDQNTEQTEDN